MADQAASVLARLKNKAKDSGISYQQWRIRLPEKNGTFPAPLFLCMRKGKWESGKVPVIRNRLQL